MRARAARPSAVDSILSLALIALVVLCLAAFIVSPWLLADAAGIVTFGLFCLSTIPAAR